MSIIYSNNKKFYEFYLGQALEQKLDFESLEIIQRNPTIMFEICRQFMRHITVLMALKDFFMNLYEWFS